MLIQEDSGMNFDVEATKDHSKDNQVLSNCTDPDGVDEVAGTEHQNEASVAERTPEAPATSEGASMESAEAEDSARANHENEASVAERTPEAPAIPRFEKAQSVSPATSASKNRTCVRIDGRSPGGKKAQEDEFLQYVNAGKSKEQIKIELHQNEDRYGNWYLNAEKNGKIDNSVEREVGILPGDGFWSELFEIFKYNIDKKSMKNHIVIVNNYTKCNEQMSDNVTVVAKVECEIRYVLPLEKRWAVYEDNEFKCVSNVDLTE